MANLEISLKLLDTVSKWSGRLRRVGSGSSSGSLDVDRPSVWRLHGIGERHVVSVREEAHGWFRVTGDVDTECVAECLDNLSQVIALGAGGSAKKKKKKEYPPSRRYTWVARSSVRSDGPPSLEFV